MSGVLSRRNGMAFAGGAVIGTLGGLIGLGGAEFRLPLLLTVFGFGALPAVILNKALSLVVVITALPARAQAISWATLAAQWPVVVNLLAGSLLGAWYGAGWALRMRTRLLYRIIAALLFLLAGALLFGHGLAASSGVADGLWRWLAGALSGFAIGVVAALLGVAGGEFLIPTLILLFGVDIKLAGSLSLAVSLPTMLMGFARYSRDSSFAVLAEQRQFLLSMALGSVGGVVLGGRLLAWINAAWLLPLLAVLLAASAIKVWRHE